MAFWRRKKEDRYITLGLNQPGTEIQADESAPETSAPEAKLEPPAAASAAPSAPESVAVPPVLEPVPTGAQPTPDPAAESGLTEARKVEVVESPQPTPTRPVPERQPQRPAPARASSALSSSSSILGLNRTEEELAGRDRGV